MTSIFGPEVTPVDLTPEQAFTAGMRLEQYARLEHGREHNARMRVFRRLLAERRADSVREPGALATRRDIALLVAALYGHHAGYSGNIDDFKKAEGFAEVLEVMGGRL